MKSSVNREAATNSETTPIRNALKELDHRVQTGKAKSRDIDELLHEIAEAITVLWPKDPEEGFGLIVTLFTSLIEWYLASRGNRTGSSLVELSAWRLSYVLRSMEKISIEQMDILLQIWRKIVVLNRQEFGAIILDSLPKEHLLLFEKRAQVAFARLKSDFDAMPIVRTKEMRALPSASRDFMLLLVELHLRFGNMEEAQNYLSKELSSDPKVMLTAAHLFHEKGDLEEASSRIHRAIIIEDNPAQFRAYLVDILMKKGEFEGAIEQILLLLEETGDIFYWYVLAEYLKKRPDVLEGVRKRLKRDTLSLYVDVMMSEGEYDAVKVASRGKTFSYDQLWKVGYFLSTSRPKTAARVFERAVTLQSAVSQSRAQTMDLADRMEGIRGFFARLGRHTKLRRLTKEILRKNRHNLPLQREFRDKFQ